MITHPRRPPNAALSSRSEQTRLDHVGQYSFDPKTLQGNIENFIGAAQVPIGLA